MNNTNTSQKIETEHVPNNQRPMSKHSSKSNWKHPIMRAYNKGEVIGKSGAGEDRCGGEVRQER